MIWSVHSRSIGDQKSVIVIESIAESKDFEFDPEVHDFWDAFFYLAFYHDESFDTFLTRGDGTLQRFLSFDL